MSKLEKEFLPQETLLYQAKRHWVVFILPIIFSVLSIIFLNDKDVLILLGYLFGVIAFVQWIYAAAAYFTAQYALTNKRILAQVGFLQKTSVETLLAQIAGIRIDQSFLGSLLGYGTIIMQGPNGAHERFTLVSQPKKFRHAIQSQIEKVLTPKS